MPDRPLRIALWCAVSSAAQAADDKTSLDDQRQAGEAFAAAVGGSVVTRYTVPGHSRDFVLWQDAEAAIPAYRELRADCERHTFDVLHAVDADRLGRTAALIHQVIGLVEAAGAEVYLASSPHTVGQATVAQRYVSAIQAVRAEEDQAIRVARHERGMRGRVRRGLVASNWPYGYSVVRDATGASIGAELVPEEVAVVRHMTRRFLAGASFRAIGKELVAAGYPSQRGGVWNSAYVRAVLHNDAYAGYPSWGNAQPEEPSSRYPHIWDATTHAAVVAERRRRGSRQHHTTPLMDVAFCRRCGSRMSRSTYLSDYDVLYVYLRCSHHAVHRDCHANHVHEDDAREAVVAYLTEELADADRVERLARSRAGPQADLQQALANLDARLEEVGARRQRLALALAAGDLGGPMYRQTDDALLDDLDGINAARVQVEAQLEAVPSWEQQVATMTGLLESLDTLWEMPPREAAAMLQSVGVRVWCEEGEVVSVGFVGE